jgi:hypothetical protein
MKKPKYDFVFSSRIEDWMSDSKERERTREKRHKRYEGTKDNPGRAHMRMMNDNMRAA